MRKPRHTRKKLTRKRLEAAVSDLTLVLTPCNQQQGPGVLWV